MASSANAAPEGIFTPLDTDLYKLTMQCAVLKFFPNVKVIYSFTNRTEEKKLTRAAFNWLQEQISRLANLQVTDEEIDWLQKTCPYLGSTYLDYLRSFRFKPAEHIVATFAPENVTDTTDDSALGQVNLSIEGLWLETILYEIPLLALTSEAYFKFVDQEWSHAGQVANAKRKCAQLIENGCTFSEFGSRRRRDYATQDMVMTGIMQAVADADKAPPVDEKLPGRSFSQGKFSGTSNVHFAMKYGCAPIGTVAHEWTMGIAALNDDPAGANELALQYWVRTFGRGVLAIALTDTFGTETFLRSFVKPAAYGDDEVATNRSTTSDRATYADVFTGVRQDSGDPLDFLSRMKDFYISQGILSPGSLNAPRKTIVYSDSLNTQKCIKYARATEEAGLTPSFGVGTFFTNDFVRQPAATAGGNAAQKDINEGAREGHQADGEKSSPLNIVIKLREVEGRSAVKLSDDIGKNMGDEDAVFRYKSAVGYRDHSWEGADERNRWT
ncbi:nicotinate phosphoribosyltransferase [Dissoconium aciculare CBS 342.82]|uniref:nicotinate phosphoribosyltransferase n=1 Tax=Dissoconium aciculare CBS 342.82 TaxID=1314786 RepID=A0A6J3MIZ0_9PEZI|nr:nicotinate phosphoribosyltransferase [Dissoconium aciculare CBS 342.82]KAF1827878.1 nicotinate phosphoribosyltransferase [Dissoconium aciculare CBS 342.82]